MTAPPTQRLDLEHAKSPASLVLLSSAALHATAAVAGGWGAGRKRRDKETEQVRQMRDDAAMVYVPKWARFQRGAKSSLRALQRGREKPWREE